MSNKPPKKSYFSPRNLRKMATSRIPTNSVSNGQIPLKYDMFVFETSFNSDIPGCGVIKPVCKPTRVRKGTKRMSSEDPLDPIEESDCDDQPPKKKSKKSPLLDRNDTPYPRDLELIEEPQSSPDVFAQHTDGTTTPQDLSIEETQPYASQSTNDDDLLSGSSANVPYEESQQHSKPFSFCSAPKLPSRRSAFMRLDQARVFILPTSVPESPPRKSDGNSESVISKLLNGTKPKVLSDGHDVLEDTPTLTSNMVDGVECPSDAHLMTNILSLLTEVRALRNRCYLLSKSKNGNTADNEKYIAQIHKDIAIKIQTVQTLLTFSFVDINDCFFKSVQQNV